MNLIKQTLTFLWGLLRALGWIAIIVIALVLLIGSFLMWRACSDFSKETPKPEEKIEKKALAVTAISPNTLDHDYQETLFLIYGKGLTEEIFIGTQQLVGVSKKIPRTPWEVGPCGTSCHGESHEEVAAGFLQVPPTIDKRLTPGRYDVVVKKDGKEVAKMAKAVEVLPNPYAVIKFPYWLGTPWKKFAVAVAMIFIVAVIGGALIFIFRKRKKP